MVEKKVRGTLINGYLSAVKKFWGNNGLDECLEYTGIDRNKIKDNMWYPIKYHIKIHEWLGNKGERYITRASRFAIQNLGMMSYLVRFISMERLLKRAPKSYNDTFNFGSIDVKLGKKSALVKLKDVITDDYSCYAWKGVFLGGLDSTKTEGNVEIIDHEEKSEKDCFLKIQWD